MSATDTSFIADLPSGSLDLYRKKATFNWKKLKLVFEDPELLKIKLQVWKTLENDPLFQRLDIEPDMEELKRRAALQLHRYRGFNFIPGVSSMEYKRKTRYLMTVNEALAVCYPDVSVKHAVGVSLFANTLLTLGTERHKHVYDSAWSRKVLSCLALTEVAHGSDTKRMRTTATYDRNTQEFVIHTPDFESAKCWIGNLGKTCTLALLFAQLYTRDQCHGLHAFVVPIRDPNTLLPYPGVVVGDMGEKIGLNGIDNGFMMFNNYRIPRENLLNRTGDVTPEGEYESSFSDPARILGAALENLSTGRVGIMQESVGHLINAVTIAIRYAAVRKQFGPNGDTKEYPILEYQLHQWRLFPYVAAATVFKVFVYSFTDDYLEAVEKTTTETRIESLGEMVSEIHAIVSAAKPLLTWTCRDAVQESREACGGHGFLKAARLGDLRNTNDPCVTYEGDNNVLVQQTSNWLLRQWNAVLQETQFGSPLESCSFLKNHQSILSRKFTGRDINDIINFNFITDCYEWLITYLLSETDLRQKEIEKNACKFSARNNTQVYKAAVLSRAYAEFLSLRYFWKKVHNNDIDKNVNSIAETLGILYGLNCLDRHLIYFYQGGYTNGPLLINLVKESVLHLCSICKPNIVSVIDALAPPDYVVNSILGKSDGKLYQHLQAECFKALGARPPWWHQMRDDCKLKSNL